jgi:hypothetical protein
MTRWNLLSDLFIARPENRDAIGKAWPLFFLLIFSMKKDNEYPTSYAELKEILGACPNTIKDWRDHLVKNNVTEVGRGKSPLIFTLLPPYDSLVTCEQSDEAQIKMVGDPATKQLLEKINGYGSMSFLALLPVIGDITKKLENLERKVG